MKVYAPPAGVPDGPPTPVVVEVQALAIVSLGDTRRRMLWFKRLAKAGSSPNRIRFISLRNEMGKDTGEGKQSVPRGGAGSRGDPGAEEAQGVAAAS